MAIPLKQATASQEILLGPFVDTDGAAVTDLTIANTDIKLWVAGATTLADKNSGGATHISGGYYYAVLDATDTAALGPLVANVFVSGALPVRTECLVIDADSYDALAAGTGYPKVDVQTIMGNDANEFVYRIRVEDDDDPNPSTTSFEVVADELDGALVVAKADDYFNGWKIRGTKGVNKGEVVDVTDWVTSSNVLTFDALPAAAVEGDEFILYKS